MSYSYDSYGRLSATEIEGRTTELEPPQPADGKEPIWADTHWVLAVLPTPPAPDLRPAQRAAIQAQLDAIDVKSSSPRAIREVACGNTVWVKSLDAQAVALRAELAAIV